MFAFRRRLAEADGFKNFFQFRNQFAGREAVQIFQHTVVGQNLHLVVRKNYGEKLAAVTRAVARFENATGRRAAMMSVRDVKRRNLRELRFNKGDFVCAGNCPRRVAHAVRTGEIHGGRFRNFLGDERIKIFLRAIGQKNRSGLRVQSFDVADAVVFFVGARELVLFDDVRQIFFATRGGDEANLRVFAHDLPIQIKIRFVVLLECAL